MIDVTEQDRGNGWLAARWARLSTGIKMLLILSLGLLPLGVIAISATVYNARENSAQRAEQTLGRLEDKAERLDELLARSAGTLRAAGLAVAAAGPGSPVCEDVLRRLERLQMAPARYALYGTRGEARCATPGFAPSPSPAPPGQTDTAIEISQDGQMLRLTLYDDRQRLEGIVEFGRVALRDLTFIPGTRADFNLELVGGGRRMLLREDYTPVPFVQTVSDSATIGGGRMQLRIMLGSAPIGLVDVVIILMPVLMWIAAAFIGWLIVNRLLLLPLGRLERVISAYRPGTRALALPAVRSPAREIGDLGAAFDEVTRTVARHEADLEAALERQTRLVREVHHRVKNNLQVVASLLNLHSRGSTSEAAAEAYASIQRRVDALAVVHRNHYAELEENRGVALRPLVSELAQNLRATAPPPAANMQIRLAVAPLSATQDVAVSVAFLITEVVELGMLCGAKQVSIVLDPAENGCARLAIEVDSLVGPIVCEERLAERVERIITGLARQLRSQLERDPARGLYAVDIAIVAGDGQAPRERSSGLPSSGE